MFIQSLFVQLILSNLVTESVSQQCPSLWNSNVDVEQDLIGLIQQHEAVLFKSLCCKIQHRNVLFDILLLTVLLCKGSVDCVHHWEYSDHHPRVG